MNRASAFPTRLHMRPAKISMRIRTVWSEYSQGTLWVAKDPKRLQADSEDSGQHARMHRLMWVFAGRSCNPVGIAVARLICDILGRICHTRVTYLLQKMGYNMKDIRQIAGMVFNPIMVDIFVNLLPSGHITFMQRRINVKTLHWRKHDVV